MSDDTEPDNVSTPETIAAGATAKARLDYRGDTDWFRTELVAGCAYPASVSSRNRGLLPGVRFFHSNGGYVRVLHDDGNYFSWSFAPASSGTYYVAAYSRSGNGGAGGYSLVLDSPIQVSGVASADYAENGASAVAAYAAAGTDSAVTWSLIKPTYISAFGIL